MKKIILIIFASLMFTNIGYAVMRVSDEGSFNFSGNYITNVATACIDGYKFVITRAYQTVSTVQFYEERDGKSLPAEC